MAEASHEAVSGDLSIEPIVEYPSYPIGACCCWVDLKLVTQESYYEYRPRPTMDIVVVIDRSKSMYGNKISLVKNSINFILSQLDMQDRLAVVVFDSTAQTIFPFTPVTPHVRDTLFVKIESISIGKGTNLCEGLKTGIKLLMERKTNRHMSSLLLFSDGLPTVGITEKRAIVNAMHNPYNQPSVLHVLANSLKKKDKPHSVNTFGIGTKHDPRMLQTISQEGGGVFYSLVELQKIPHIFADFLGGLLSTYAQQISLKLSTISGAKLDSLMVREDSELSEDGKRAYVKIPDMQLGEERDILLKLSLPPHKSEFIQNCFVILQVSYTLSDSDKMIRKDVRVVVRRSVASDVIPRADANVSIQRNRWRAVEAMREAREKASLGELGEAKRILKGCKSDIYKSSTALGFLSKFLVEDLDRIIQELASETSLSTSGCSLLTTSMDCHSRQRSTSYGTGCYSTHSRDNMLSESARFNKSVKSVL